MDNLEYPVNLDVRRVPSGRIDSQLSRILDDAQHRGSATVITRRGTVSAVIVPPGWYTLAEAALRGEQPYASEAAAVVLSRGRYDRGAPSDEIPGGER